MSNGTNKGTYICIVWQYVDNCQNTTSYPDVSAIKTGL